MMPQPEDQGASTHGGVHLALRCQACDTVHTYWVLGVVTGVGQAPMVVGEFPCTACGVYAPLTLTAGAYRSLLGTVFRSLLLRRAPVTQRVIVETAEGQRASLPRAYLQLQAQTNDHPQDALAWLRMGMIEHALERPRAARMSMNHAYRADPHLLEAVINQAILLESDGDSQHAWTVLLRALRTRAQWWSCARDPQEKVEEFAALYNRMRSTYGADQTRALMPDFYTLNRGKRFE